jgi:integrase
VKWLKASSCLPTLIKHPPRLINGDFIHPNMFKDNFITIARAHGLSLSTERAYFHCARKHIKRLGAKSVKDMERDPTTQVREHLTALANEHPNRTEGDEGISASSQNLYFYSLRFLYEKVLGLPLGDLSGIPKAHGHERIVDVPPDDIAKKLVESVPGKPGTALRLIYGTAGRLNDILRLRVKDLDFRKKLVAIQESKGGKSRLVPMPESLLPELIGLVKERERLHDADVAAGGGGVHMPGKLAAKYPDQIKSLGWQYLFNATQISRDPVSGQFGRHHLMAAGLQRAFADARRKLRIKRHYTVHSLRHATAQYWERKNVPLSDIQKLLGHERITTTQRYLLSGIKGVPKVPSPI